MILADCGFICEEYARTVLAEVKTPPFTKGKNQLEKVDVDWSRELSLVRIYVERVIGVLKQKYAILVFFPLLLWQGQMEAILLWIKL